MANGPYEDIDDSLDGLQYGLDPRIETGAAMEIIQFGKAVMGYQAFPGKAYNLHIDRATGLFSADFVASNSIAVTINGIAVTPVVFTVDQATTRAAVITAINANVDVAALGISAAPGAGTRDIVLKAKGIDLSFSAVVTLGASQATMSTTYDTWAQFLGVSFFAQRSGKDYGAGNAAYQINDTVNILAEGTISVPVTVAVEANQPAYAIYAAGADQGKFTNSSSATKDVGGYFRTNRVNNRAILEVRGLK